MLNIHAIIISIQATMATIFQLFMIMIACSPLCELELEILMLLKLLNILD